MVRFNIIILECVLLMFSCNITDSSGKKQNTEVKLLNQNIEKKDDLIQLEKQNPDNFYLSCFSLSEIRMFIPFDSIEYQNTLYLDDILDKLDDNERREILNSVIENNNKLLEKKEIGLFQLIESWVELKIFFDDLSKKSFYSLDFLMEVLYRFEKTNSLFSGLVDDEGYGLDGLSSYQMNFIYYEAINKVSRLKRSDKTKFKNYLQEKSNW